jgi:hypothetical protein
MARRNGPLFESLIYDKAYEADHVMRHQTADSHQGQERDRSATGRIDSCILRRRSNKSPCAGGVHRLS